MKGTLELGGRWKSFEARDRKYLDFHRLLVERWVEGTSGESSEGHKEYVMGNWGKADLAL